MTGVNILRTKVLITTDEVVFHAPTDDNVDVRSLLQSIIIAERRFIKPFLGSSVYNLLVENKNLLVTSSNKAALQAVIDATRPADREQLVLNVGDYVNSDTYLTDYQLELWQYSLHKLVAECVYFVSLPVNRSRFTASGVVKNHPETITEKQDSVTIDLKDLKHLLDKSLLERIEPLMDDAHQHMCDVGFPGYTRDCGCYRPSVSRRGTVLFGLYDDDDDKCCDEPIAVTSFSSPKNETIPFEDQEIVIVPWTTSRKQKYGAAGAFVVEVKDGEGEFHVAVVDITPDSIDNTTFYTIDMGGVATGRIIIS